jgi:hypothetical protein
MLQCLPSSKEGKELASMKLGVPSKLTVLEPMHHGARVLTKDAKVSKVRSTQLPCFRVIKDL